MRAVRRLYFYLVAFITLEVVMWGLIGLLRSILSPVLSGSEDALASSLSLILVGVPLFLLHWLWAQRVSAADQEEQTSTLRAVFLYGVLLATLVPVVQNALAFVDRSLLELADLETYNAVLGGEQSWVDNLIAILLNGVAAWYFESVLRRDWPGLANTDNFADVRRLYRYIWHLYGFLMTVFGAQQVIQFLLYIPSEVLGQTSRDLLMNGLSLLIVGAPLWVVSWRACQAAALQPGERDSNLRFGVLFLLTLSGVAVVLSAGGTLLNYLLRWALGEVFSITAFLREITDAVSLGVPFATVWAYYGLWLNRDTDAVTDVERRDGLRRFYHYVLAFAGLVSAFTGLALILSFIIDVVADRQLWGVDLRSRVSAALATALVGLPVWLIHWRPMQAKALVQGIAGGAARRSLVRKVYLYLALFAAVMGGMVSAVNLVNHLLQALLGSEPLDVTGLLNALQLLILFLIMLAYHLTCLRVDGSEATRALIERREQFTTLVFEGAGSGFGDAIRAAAEKQAQGLAVTVLEAGAAIPAEASSARVAILPSSLAVHPTESLRAFLDSFEGRVIVVPQSDSKWLWVDHDRKPAENAAIALRQLSEGQPVKLGGTSAFMAMVYIFAAIAALELLLLLVSLGVGLLLN